MRKIFSKKVVTTTIKSSKVSFDGGQPVAVENEAIVFIGRATDDKAQEMVTKEFGIGNMVTENLQDEKVYKFNLLDILQYALPDEDVQDGDEIEEEND